MMINSKKQDDPIYIKGATVIVWLPAENGAQTVRDLLNMGAEQVTLLGPTYIDLLTLKTNLVDVDDRIVYARRDISEPWYVGKHAYDLVVFPNQVLSEEQGEVATNEAQRALKPQGLIVYASGSTFNEVLGKVQEL